MRVVLLAGLALLPAGCGREPSTGKLTEQLNDADAAKRVEAIKVLSRRTAEKDAVVPALIGALADANPFVRRDAATALGRFGLEAKPAAGALNRLLKDKEKSVRRAAADALQRMEAAK